LHGLLVERFVRDRGSFLNGVFLRLEALLNPER
jgi:hypothetical protein